MGEIAGPTEDSASLPRLVVVVADEFVVGAADGTPLIEMGELRRMTNPMPICRSAALSRAIDSERRGREERLSASTCSLVDLREYAPLVGRRNVLLVGVCVLSPSPRL